MNLTDYPTPRIDFEWDHYVTPHSRRHAETPIARLTNTGRQLEREAAAWREVAEAIHSASNLDELQSAHDAFDALKAQLNETKP